MRFLLTFIQVQSDGSARRFYGNEFDSYTSKVLAIKEAIDTLEHGIYDSATISYFDETENCFKHLINFDRNRNGGEVI